MYDYPLLIKQIMRMCLKTDSPMETAMRISNLHQRYGESSAMCDARLTKAMFYKFKKDIQECKNHAARMHLLEDSDNEVDPVTQ